MYQCDCRDPLACKRIHPRKNRQLTSIVNLSAAPRPAQGDVLKRLAFALVSLLFAPLVLADFGDYLAHEVSGDTVTIRSDRGEVRVRAIGDQAFEIHYLETDVKQLPSFALAPDLSTAVPTVGES